MPVAQIYLLEGRSDEQKETLIASVTAAIADSLEVQEPTVRVILIEMPKQNFGIGGKSTKKLGR